MVAMVNGKWSADQGNVNSLMDYAKPLPSNVKNYTYNPIAPPSFNYTPSAQLQQQIAGLQRFNAPLMPRFNFPTQFQTRQATPLNQYVKGLLS